MCLAKGPHRLDGAGYDYDPLMELIGEAPATPPKTKRRRKASTAAKAAKKAAAAASRS